MGQELPVVELMEGRIEEEVEEETLLEEEMQPAPRSQRGGPVMSSRRHRQA